MKNTLIFILILGLGFIAFTVLERSAEPRLTADPEIQNPDTVTSYISRNISALSPEKAVLGGTFYVTNITLDAGTGTVEYEDGHNAFVADFTYGFEDDGSVRVTSFEIVE
jgi:hypothetical protein